MYLFPADLNRLNEKLTETEKVKMELQLKMDDVQSSEASAQVFKKKNHELKMSVLFPLHQNLI